ncbi:hypothetical protein BGZ61DRAFT_486419 [Ilyonectria robusta]|uniref:uncharacterized protein n=1 Tax=Ilyonectria robusta TaxID=1079257 RepID=UPI001E8D2A59|nr:uncharacterized protein BGZ61DRAFT_486419 [Ilyonectria robusta]KAH8656923.1 hypothetical protein BGZ61DRAFT_486419 [Ilyonectria robusta]
MFSGDNAGHMSGSSKKHQDKPASLFSFGNPERGGAISKPSGVSSTPFSFLGNPVSEYQVTKHPKICTCSSGQGDGVGFGKSDQSKAGRDFPFSGNSERGDKMAEPPNLDLSSKDRHNTKPLFGVNTDRQEDTSAFLDPHGRTYGTGLFGAKPEGREPTKSLWGVGKTPQTPLNPYTTIANVDKTPQYPFSSLFGPQSRTNDTSLFGPKPECKNNTTSSLNSNTMPQKWTLPVGNKPKDRNSKVGVLFPGKRDDHVTELFNSRSECRDDTKLALGLNSLPQKYTGLVKKPPQDRNDNTQVSNLPEKRKRHVHWSSDTEAECRDDTRPLLSPNTKRQKLTPKHDDTSLEDIDPNIDEDVWSVEYAASENTIVNCPGGYTFHIETPQHWGEHVIITTSARKITIVNRAEARGSLPIRDYRNPVDLGRYLAPDRKVANIWVRGAIWKIDLVIREDDSIEFGYHERVYACR